MAFGFKAGEENQHHVKVAIKKYAVDRKFKWMGLVSGLPLFNGGHWRIGEHPIDVFRDLRIIN